MRTALVLLLIGLPAAPAVAADGKVPRSPELQAIVDEAGRCAPEIEADALVRLAPALGRDDPKWEREALERAFAVAADAEIATPLGVWRGISTETDEARRSMASDFEIDALSLRCRVVRWMLDVDAKRAFEMFLLIDREPPA